MTGRLKGVDVSSNNHAGDAPIDFEALRKAGYAFVIVKATQGIDYVNPWLARDLSDAFAEGLMVGAYHYFEVGPDPVVQAKHFTGMLIGHKLELGAWLDFEPPSAEPWQAAGWVNTFLTEAHEARPGTGLYANASQWAALKGASVTVPRLWLADWTEDPDLSGVFMWQSGFGEVPGVPGQTDTDWLMSTRGLNILTTPPARPSAATAKPVPLPAEPGPDEAGEADNSQEDDSLNQHG